MNGSIGGDLNTRYMAKGFCLVLSAERCGEYRLSNHLLHNHVTNRIIVMDIHMITSSCATMSLSIFLKVGSGLNGEHSVSLVLIFSRSTRSLSSQAFVKSLCSSDVEKFVLVNSWIAILYSVDDGQRALCSS